MTNLHSSLKDTCVDTNITSTSITLFNILHHKTTKTITDKKQIKYTIRSQPCIRHKVHQSTVHKLYCCSIMIHDWLSLSDVLWNRKKGKNSSNFLSHSASEKNNQCINNKSLWNALFHRLLNEWLYLKYTLFLYSNFGMKLKMIWNSFFFFFFKTKLRKK